MRVYDGEFTVGRILERCRTVPSGAFTRSGPVEGVDLDELRRIINRIPVNTIRARRAKLNVFYEEVLVSADPDFGISFTSCLMILAHHNVISDSKSLRLVFHSFILERLWLTFDPDWRNSYDDAQGCNALKRRFVVRPLSVSLIRCTGLVNSAATSRPRA